MRAVDYARPSEDYDDAQQACFRRSGSRGRVRRRSGPGSNDRAADATRNGHERAEPAGTAGSTFRRMPVLPADEHDAPADAAGSAETVTAHPGESPVKQPGPPDPTKAHDNAVHDGRRIPRTWNDVGGWPVRSCLADGSRPRDSGPRQIRLSALRRVIRVIDFSRSFELHNRH